MKCEVCGLKDAVIHIRQIQKDLVHELHICEECAQDKGIIREEESELPIANLLSGLLEGRDFTEAAEARDVCPRCGRKASEFRKLGKLGCPECFKAFDRDVRTIIAKMAGKPRHAGKVSRALANQGGGRAAENEGLQEALREAVEKEEYEKAALLRDRIRGKEPDV